MYDIFYVSRRKIHDSEWLSFKSKYSAAQKIEYVKNFDEIKNRAFTKMFWVVWDDLILDDNFDLTGYQATEWDDSYIHIFQNGDNIDGICLFPKSISVSQREFDSRYFIAKKEVLIVASKPKPYKRFTVDNYEDYQQALTETTSDLFWAVPSDVIPLDEFSLDNYFVRDRVQNHVFKHRNKEKDSYDGIFLCSVFKPLSKNEIQYRFPVERKEWDIVASVSKPYDKFYINTYEEYKEAFHSSTTELFWVIPNDVVVEQNFKFDLRFMFDNLYDRKMNHVFLNGEQYDGIMLLSKHKPISEREFKYRFLVDKKEWDILASTPKPYDKFYIDTYEEYQKALAESTTEMFWMLSHNLSIAEDFNIDEVRKYDRNQNHAFIHRVDDKDTYNGIFLCSKNKPLTKNEVKFRFPVERVEWPIVASGPVIYTVYGED